MVELIGKLPPQEVIDVRCYAVNGSVGAAYIGTESGPGSEELTFSASAEFARRAKPWIEAGELYGFILPLKLIIRAATSCL